MEFCVTREVGTLLTQTQYFGVQSWHGELLSSINCQSSQAIGDHSGTHPSFHPIWPTNLFDLSCALLSISLIGLMTCLTWVVSYFLSVSLVSWLVWPQLCPTFYQSHWSHDLLTWVVPYFLSVSYVSLRISWKEPVRILLFVTMMHPMKTWIEIALPWPIFDLDHDILSISHIGFWTLFLNGTS